jgi:hypothetical protein
LNLLRIALAGGLRRIREGDGPTGVEGFICIALSAVVDQIPVDLDDATDPVQAFARRVRRQLRSNGPSGGTRISGYSLSTNKK